MKPAELSRRRRRVIQRSHRWRDSVSKDHVGRPIYAGSPNARRMLRTATRQGRGL